MNIQVSGEQTMKRETLMELFKKHIIAPLSSLFEKGTDPKTYGDSIIRNIEGKVLLLQRSYQDDFQPGKWSLPGGKIEDNEMASVGAQRELDEETGLRGIDLQFFDSKKHADGSISYYYQGVLSIGYCDDLLLDNEEHYRWEWAAIEDIIAGKYDLLLDLGSILPELLSKLPPIVISLPLREDIEQTFITGLTNQNQLLTDVKTAFDNDIISLEDYSVFIRDFNEIKKNYLKKALDEGLISDEEYLIEKASKMAAVIGERKNFGGKEYIKTADGWRYHGNGNSANARQHASSALDYHIGEKQKSIQEESDKKEKTSQLAEYAKNTPEATLQKVIKEHGDPALRLAAQHELRRRQKEEIPSEEEEDVDPTNPFLAHKSNKK